MKTIKLTTIFVAAGMAFLFAACSETESIDESLNLDESIDFVDKSAELEALLRDSCTFSGTLTESEIEGLMEMREEEKLAGDVYTKFYEIYGIPIFNNISKSENVHTTAVLYLINGYGLQDPAVDGVGEFANAAFGELYKTLTEKGAVNIDEALKVGAFIEEYDIADLQRLLDEMQNADVKRVYGNLLRASTFHMKAFSNVLKLRGETYSPTIISNEEYQEILNN